MKPTQAFTIYSERKPIAILWGINAAEAKQKAADLGFGYLDSLEAFPRKPQSGVKPGDFRPIAVHDLRDVAHSTAYDLTQTQEYICDGDVIMLSGGAVAVLVQAWPTLVVGESDCMERIDSASGYSWHNLDGGKYSESAKLAEKVSNS